MVLCFAPFPALERVALTDKFVSGETQKPIRVSTFAGGPGARAATTARLFGAETLLVGFAGGRIGELFAEALDRQDVPHVLTPTKSETRGNFLLLDRTTGLITQIAESAPEVSEAEGAKLLASLARHLGTASHLVVTGDDDGDAGLVRRAADAAKASGVPVIADAKGATLAALLEGGDLFLLRVSHKTLQRFAETSLMHDSAIVRAAQTLRDAHRVRHVVVTLGEEGALLIGDGGATRVVAPVVSHFNPSGGGQALVGTLAARLTQNNGDVLDALRYGCAAASVNVTHDEPAYATPAEARILLAKTTAVPVQIR